ncbi:MAG TPA: beta-galactosidase [Mycobacteriales bacterium]|nr:beta-galactosidase [Mycobacteriales bacterium]
MSERVSGRATWWNRDLTRRRLLEGTLQVGALAAGSLAFDAAPVRASITCGGSAGTAGMGPVFGAELQYFRMRPSYIPARLDLCQQAAFTTIQSYVAWNVHEYLPGQFDFTGRTHPVLPDDHADEYQIETPAQELQDGGIIGGVANTDLHGFLGMCRERGFRVILRPGPFISDEWRNGGLPDWLLLAGYPQIYERGPDGSALTPGFPFSPPAGVVTGGGPLFYFPSPSYASSSYLASARAWFAAFAAFIRPWLASAGGPVVNIQVDDESCFYYRFGPFEVDYHPEMIARYRAVEGSSPPTAWPPPAAGVSSLRPAFAWQSFKAAQVTAFLATLAADLRASRVDVPVTHELELTLAPPADMARDAAHVQLNPELYVGGTDPWTLPCNELCALAARAAQRNRGVLWATEMENDNIVLYDLLFGEGILGGLQFTYTAGVPDGALGDLGRLGRTLRTAGERLGAAIRRPDVAIIWDNALTRAPYRSQRWGFRTDVRNVIERDVPALATLLIRGGFAFDLLDADAAEAADYRDYPTVFLAAADILPRRVQEHLVAYVAAGGRLVCWPAPPNLDEDLNPCTILADALYFQPRRTFYPADAQQVRVLGVLVSTWRGVSTYRLGPHARSIASRGGESCGYAFPYGHGEALLLGSWLAADSIPGRAGSVLQTQALPTPIGAPAAARALAEQFLGPAVVALVPNTFPGGPAQTLLVYDYTNERRGGEVITGGALAYWDGEQVVGLAELNTTQTGGGASRLPFRPVQEAHLEVIRALANVHPQIQSSDARVQARILDAPTSGTATVMAANRGDTPVETVLTTTLSGKVIRLPTEGTLRLPPATAVLLPLGYELAPGVVVEQSSAQLVSADPGPGSITLRLWAPAGGELVIRLPASPDRATLGGRAIALSPQGRPPGGLVRIALPAGDLVLELTWTATAATCATGPGPARADTRRLPATGTRTSLPVLGAVGLGIGAWLRWLREREPNDGWHP